ncbi:tRNA (adenosine(37)-N6)-threonylcarbamoyltransferase complex ATPase subunit type 1 TsaE [Candidatus Babeliales bacterium]|nr:tRNA (adenosine(37)-N6)-threonylcarbamoyltransferase complex ATPase subunit type 1 TsaE [Candidatus Babeliales bacterium]
MMAVRTFSLEDLDIIVRELVQLKNKCRVYTFTGPLGSGKTTLVRQMLKVMGVEGVISSPTFTYVNTYITKDDAVIHHFDLYRLQSYNGFIEQGFDEYLYQPDSWSFIEWPEVIMPLVHHNACHVTLDYVSQDQRSIEYMVAL